MSINREHVNVLLTLCITTSCDSCCKIFPSAVGRSQLFCYYSSYAQNRPDVGKFVPENIDPNLCTHVIFTFADVIQGTNLKASGWNDLENGKDSGMYSRSLYFNPVHQR